MHLEVGVDPAYRLVVAGAVVAEVVWVQVAGKGALERVAARLDHHHLGVRRPAGGQVEDWRLLAGRHPEGSPPAMAISSGIHVPPSITGSSHSMPTTRGRSAAAARRSTGSSHASSCATRASPAVRRPRAAATDRSISPLDPIVESREASRRQCRQPAHDLGGVVARVLHGSAPFPSLADALYLAGCPLIGLGLVGLVRTYGRPGSGQLDRRSHRGRRVWAAVMGLPDDADRHQQ